MLLLAAVFLVAMHGHLASAQRITQNQFNAAVTSNGYPWPDQAIYPHLADATRDFSREELAMFMAQVIHESGGFQFKEEIACKETKCPGSYVDNVGLPGRYYYGRGYIQLTWGANYRDASQALGMGNRLLKDPDVVASDTRIAVLVSAWYWRRYVRPALAGHGNQFGVTTRAINGAIECSGGWNERAASRYRIYQKVANVMGIQNRAVENGCYN